MTRGGGGKGDDGTHEREREGKKGAAMDGAGKGETDNDRASTREG